MIFRRRRYTIFLFLLILVLILYICSRKPRKPKYGRFAGLQNETLLPNSARVPIYHTNCISILNQMKLPVPFLIIDIDFLKMLDKNYCKWSSDEVLKVAVNSKYSPINYSNSKLDIIFYENDSAKDYLDLKSEVRRLIPKKFQTHWVENIEIPTNIKQFTEFWKRSKFIDCLKLEVPRDKSYVFMPAEPAVEELAQLRDELIEFDMYPFLNGGTFLGWYRECSIIPHTTDMDLSVFAKDYNPIYVELLHSYWNPSSFEVWRMLGMVEDSFEITIQTKKWFEYPIDLFLMYEGIENGKLTHHWVGGIATDGTKYKFTYPIYDPWCAADLHGHIFWVSCNPLEKILAEYGEDWKKDHLSSEYRWNYSQKNVQTNGKYTAEQMKMLYRKATIGFRAVHRALNSFISRIPIL